LIGTIITFLDVIHRLVFCLKCRPVYISKRNVSETGFCLRPQVEPTQLVPIDRATRSSHLRRCTNLPSSQTFRSYLVDWMYWHIIHTTRNYRQSSATADLHTVTHAPEFSVFTSRILAPDLYVSPKLRITHEVVLSQPNSYLDIILQLPNEVNSSAPKLHIPAGGRLETRH
jgi:hypothetical protein